MKYFVYFSLAFIAALLFLPAMGTTKIRNLLLLLSILALILIFILIRFFKYIFLIAKTKKQLKIAKMKKIKIKIFPWASFFHGHYSIAFSYKNKFAQIILLSRKRKYQRYHFDRVDNLEFYRSNRVVFKSNKEEGATISKLVETKLVGKQKIKWDDTAEIRMIVFDKLPRQITDSAKKEALGVGEEICNSNIQVLDFAAFCQKIVRGM